jgi:hypothetical protein
MKKKIKASEIQPGDILNGAVVSVVDTSNGFVFVSGMTGRGQHWNEYYSLDALVMVERVEVIDA